MPIVRLPNRSKLDKILPDLVSVALGKSKADLVIKNIVLLDVVTRDFLENYSVVVKGDRIAYIGRKVDDKIGSSTLVIDGDGKYLIPGLMDGHIHIESSMLTPTRYAKVLLPRGVTSIFIDPHEMANVFGMEGVEIFLDESRNLPMKMFITLPSCVPSAPGFETSGGELSTDDIRRGLELEGVIALGEMMNFPGVLNLDKYVFDKISLTLARGYVVEGHAPSLDYKDLVAYIAGGITSCHESVKGEEAYNKLVLGMYVMLRESSVSRDLKETLPYLLSRKIDTRHLILVSDDREVVDLVNEGGIDYVVRRAIEEGLDPVDAIRMVTLNVAEHYELAREIGAVAPTRFADMLIINDLNKLGPLYVFADGKLVAKDGVLMGSLSNYKYPDKVLRSIVFKRSIKPEDFVTKSLDDKDMVLCRVIELAEGVYTRELNFELEVEDHVIRPDLDDDILYAAVIERYGKNGNIGKGFVRGFGIRSGAIASSIGHDSHNVIVVGTNSLDMAFAVNFLKRIGGGIVVVKDESVLGSVQLNVGGLMSDKDPIDVVKELHSVEEAFEALGCKVDNPHMKLSFLALAVIPELRLTDMGLIDVRKGKIVDVIIDQ